MTSKNIITSFGMLTLLWQIVSVNYIVNSSLGKTYVSALIETFGKLSFVMIVIAIQIIYRQMLVSLFEVIYKFRCFDAFKTMQNKEWPFLNNNIVRQLSKNITFDNNDTKSITVAELHSDVVCDTYINHYKINIPLFMTFTVLTSIYMKNNVLDMSIDQLPTLYEILFQLNASFLISDAIFYFAHRTLHSRKLFWIHSDHHDFKYPTVHASMRSGVIDYILEILIPGGIGLCFFKMHVITFTLYMFSGVTIDVLNHCGYMILYFPFNYFFPINELLFGEIIYKHHEKHHNKVVKNYGGVTMIYDKLFNTIDTYESNE
jgi:sterol desaturase/sphingolipid hydroxylase (fatty acid hydroxylase superfamily)